MMIKIIIVDDRPIFLEYLKTCINWNSHGFEIAAAYMNGEDAFNNIEQDKPDIILSDINMPFMDGLELSEKVKENYPGIDIVLITGKSEFELARRAVKIGVSDYILKPFEKEELVLTLLRLKDNINKSNKIKIHRDEERELFFEHFLQSLIYTDNIDEQIVKSKMDVLGINSPDSNFIVFAIEIIKETKVDSNRWKDTALRLLDELFEYEDNHFQFFDYENRIIVLAEVNSPQILNEFKNDFDKLIDLFYKHLNLNIVIGIGSVCAKYNEVRSSYINALAALNHNLSKKLVGVITFDELPTETNTYTYYFAKKNEELFELLNQGKNEEINHLLGVVFKEINESSISSQYASIVSSSLLSVIINYIMRFDVQLEEVFKCEVDDIINIGKHNNLDNQLNILKKASNMTVTYFKERKKGKSYQVAEATKQYIFNNYRRSDLTISEIAEEVYINETYLRTMFKQEVQMTIIEFISTLRMEQAKKMIETGGYTLAYIAEYVGYYDAAYLSKTFKKYFGVSPSKYKKELL